MPFTPTATRMTDATIGSSIDDNVGVLESGLAEVLGLTLGVTYTGPQAAPIAKGVTNGDTHDHSGGDGAQINHTTLSNIGTTTHTQIDAQIPTTDQKAALAGSSGTPSAANKYVTDADARNTNARTPTAHASTHASGGSDPITPAAIGASDTAHTHAGVYAPVANGVTNGDSHDHSGGDGAQINHTTLSNIGTNSHATIDSQLPSSDQKAALAGSSGTPSAANKYVTDADSRMTDARTPSAHTSSHQNGGADEISVAGLSGKLADLQDAGWLQGREVASTAPSDGQVLAWVAGTSKWTPSAGGGGGGVTDHGALTGLADDDHTQYHTDARGDARYALTAAGVTGGNAHTHSGSPTSQVDHNNLLNNGTNSHATIDSRLPTSDQKSALAGTSGTPSSTNKYVTNDDSRNTNSRTPTAHQLDSATYHTVSGLTTGHFLKATGATTFGFGAHGLTYSSVGAAAASHSHAESDVTNLVSDLAAKEAIANKDAAGGYAGLDSSTQLTQNVKWATPTTGAANGIKDTGTAGESLAFGDIVYLKAADSRWWKAKADATSTSAKFLAMAISSATAGTSVTLLMVGFATSSGWSFTVGSPYYLSPSTGAAMTATVPSTTNHVARVLGWAKSATCLWFNPDPTWVELK